MASSTKTLTVVKDLSLLVDELRAQGRAALQGLPAIIAALSCDLSSRR